MWAWIITSYITDSNKRHLYWHPHIYSSFPTAHCVLKHTPPNAMPVLHTPLWGTSALVSECQGHVSEPFRPGPKVWHNEICERPECQILTDSDTHRVQVFVVHLRGTHTTWRRLRVKQAVWRLRRPVLWLWDSAGWLEESDLETRMPRAFQEQNWLVHERNTSLLLSLTTEY